MAKFVAKRRVYPKQVWIHLTKIADLLGRFHGVFTRVICTEEESQRHRYWTRIEMIVERQKGLAGREIRSGLITHF